jgi:transcriptional regulator with XRE-family HTH domain
MSVSRIDNATALNPGARIRAVRSQRRITLEKLAEASGLSISALSKIETGQVSPAFDSLVKIAHALGMPFAQLFELDKDSASPKSEYPISGRHTFTRSGTGQSFTTAHYDYNVHSSELVQKGMIPLVMRIRTRSLPAKDEWSSHTGEEFIYVTSGETVLHTAYYAPLHLKAGDSAYIDSTMPHAFVSMGEDDAEILSICMTERLFFDQVSVGKPDTAKP